MRLTFLYNLALIICAIALTPIDSRAEMVDYGSLQSLFGEPVTTSATGTPQRTSDVAADMTIITADDIRRSGSRSIPKIIGQYVPGIDIFQTGVNSFDVGVRGYQQPFQPRLLVLVDGRQVFLDDYSRTVWASLPVNIDEIRQIEVVKGASSALFGSNAAGGVVNIITYNPVYDPINVATVRAGTQNMLSGDTTVSKKLGEKSGIRLSAGGVTSDEFNTAYKASDMGTYDPMQKYVAQSSVFQLTTSLLATMEFTVSESRENPQQPALSNRSAETTKNYSARGGLQWQTDYGIISNNNYVYHADAVEKVAGALYPATTDLIVSQLQDQFKLGTNHAFRGEMEYRHKTYDYNFQQAFEQSPAFKADVLSASGTWLWQINEKLSWTNALRIDHQSEQQTGTLSGNEYYNNSDYSHVINALSANSGLVYKATDIDTWRATYGRGIQFPSFIEGGDNVLVQTGANSYIDLEGNPNLKPTVVENYELSYDRQILSLFSSAQFSAFYEINHDLIAFAVDQSITRTIGPDTFTLDQSKNVGKSQGIGGELAFKGSRDGYRWNASYSYSRVNDAISAARTLGYDGSVPASHFRLSAGYTLGPWEFDAQGQAVTGMHMQSAVGTKTATDGYFALSSRVAYKIDERYTLALSGSNLTQAYTKTSPFPAIERQIFLTLTGRF